MLDVMPRLLQQIQTKLKSHGSIILCVLHLNERKSKIRLTKLWSKAKTRGRYIPRKYRSFNHHIMYC